MRAFSRVPLMCASSSLASRLLRPAHVAVAPVLVARPFTAAAAAWPQAPAVYGESGSWLDALRDAVGAVGLWLIKRTYQPSRLKRNRKFGFLNRSATRGGRRVLDRRRQKGRHKLIVA